MNKYDLIGKAEVVVTTSVYADSLEEAIEIAKKRGVDLSLSILSTDDEEADDNKELNENNNGKEIGSPNASVKEVG